MDHKVIVQLQVKDLPDGRQPALFIGNTTISDQLARWLMAPNSGDVYELAQRLLDDRAASRAGSTTQPALVAAGAPDHRGSPFAALRAG
jgi:hypothetical protein